MQWSDVAWLFRSDVVVLAATTDPVGAPEITRSLGARPVEADGLLRLYIPVPEGLHFLHIACETGRVAASFGRARDYRSFQAKGKAARIVPTTADDAAWVARYRTELGPANEAAGIPSALWDALVSREFATLEVQLEGFWNQTPGAAAGTPVGTRS